MGKLIDARKRFAGKEIEYAVAIGVPVTAGLFWHLLKIIYISKRKKIPAIVRITHTFDNDPFLGIRRATSKTSETTDNPGDSRA